MCISTAGDTRHVNNLVFPHCLPAPFFGRAYTRKEQLYGREVHVADREAVESGIDPILEQAKNEDVAFLVVGDPFG